MYLICETLINESNMMFKHVMGYEAMFVKVQKSIKLIKWPIFVFKNPMKMKLAKIHCLYRYMGISIDTKNTSGFCIDTRNCVSILMWDYCYIDTHLSSIDTQYRYISKRYRYKEPRMSLFSIKSHQIRGHFDPIISLKHLKVYLGPKLRSFKA